MHLQRIARTLALLRPAHSYSLTSTTLCARAAGAAVPVAAMHSVTHNAKKGFNAATKVKDKNPLLFHVLLVRHAESSNNVLAELITKEMGANPYGPNSQGAVLAEYDRRRTADPDLSALGRKQAELLPQHPHLQDLDFATLAAQGRVRVVTSPMQRAILTSQPLLRSIQPHASAPAASAAAAVPAALRATLVADVCEKGGSYVCIRGDDGSCTNKASAGHGRAELTRLWGETHDASGIAEDGWWHTSSPGAEDDAAFEARLARAQQWLLAQAAHYHESPADRPDYLLIVSHADFIDAFLTRMLRLQQHCRYVFYSSNTSISHIELESNSGGSPAVRVRGTNIKPVNIEAHELAVHHA